MSSRSLVFIIALTSCGLTEPAQVGRRSDPLGEPRDGLPSWNERTLHYLVNRARSDPQADLATCSQCAEAACYGPRPPLGWSYELARAARFHSANLSACGAFSHTSPCTLVADLGARYTPGPCDGAAACACEGGATPCTCQGTCTDSTTRVSLFGGSGEGENIASGSTDPNFVFDLWLREPSVDPTCGFSNENGHRWNILAQQGFIGIGCSGAVCTQDFGTPGELGKITVGTHSPRTGTVQFMAHWFDSAAPRQARVNLAGQCAELARERGVSGANSTWVLPNQAIAGCTRYAFVFTDAQGKEVRYPTTGAFGVDCATDWDATELPSGAGCVTACVPACGNRSCGPDGCGGTCGAGCTSPEVCSNGACASSCPMGRETCEGTCVDLQTDPRNCAACGHVCSSCVNGFCLLADGGIDQSDAGTGPRDFSPVIGRCGCGLDGGLGGLLALTAWALRPRRRNQVPGKAERTASTRAASPPR